MCRFREDVANMETQVTTLKVQATCFPNHELTHDMESTLMQFSSYGKLRAQQLIEGLVTIHSGVEPHNHQINENVHEHLHS